MNTKHSDSMVWGKYVLGEGTPAERMKLDAHLETCDACLGLYMAALESTSSMLPSVCEPEPFDVAVMTRVAETGAHVEGKGASEPLARGSASPAATAERNERGLWRHPLFHYASAAAITLLLMSAGVFRQLHVQLPKCENKVVSASDAMTVSGRLVDRMSGMLDQLQGTDRKGESPHEK